MTDYLRIKFTIKTQLKNCNDEKTVKRLRKNLCQTFQNLIFSRSFLKKIKIEYLIRQLWTGSLKDLTSF